MNTLLNSIRESFNTIITSIEYARNEILTRANGERIEMLDLVARMQETKQLSKDMSLLCAEVAEELYDMGTDSHDLADKIADTLDEPLEFCPTCPYEDLVGFCGECGAEVTYDSTYEYDEFDNSVLCAECMPKTVELAESVSGA